MAAADTDNSGTINYTEFIAATLEQSLFLKEQNLRNAFKMFDINKDGKISAEEIKQILGGQKTIQVDENQWEDILREVDVDGDGCVDYEEFIQMMKQNQTLA